MVDIKSKREIEIMKEACNLTYLTHEEIRKAIRPGISTQEINDIAEKFILAHGGIPAQKNYPSGIKGVPNFPATLCISVNDVIIHGIPSKKEILRDGDIVSIDLVVLKNGFHGDAARTYIVGKANKKAEELVKVTEQAFYEGIKYAVPGNRIGDVSHAIGEFVHQKGFSVLREFQGHGIGRQMHEDPGIPNYGKAGRGVRLQPGMTLAIEPMVIAGSPNMLELDDGWTVISEDGSLSAHYENTILVTEKEPEILTIG